MEIRLTTTEVKLTKSIVNQIPVATKSMLKDGVAVGHFVNVVTKMNKALLLTFEKDYFILSGQLYREGVLNIGMRYKKHIYLYRFSSTEKRDAYWGHYQGRLKEGHTQIYV